MVQKNEKILTTIRKELIYKIINIPKINYTKYNNLFCKIMIGDSNMIYKQLYDDLNDDKLFEHIVNNENYYDIKKYIFDYK